MNKLRSGIAGIDTAQRFHAAVASTDITPTCAELTELIPMLGQNKSLYPGGVLRPLLAKVLVTRAGEETIIVITADLHHTPKWLSDELRSRIAADLRIDVKRIAVCTSQTHSAPEVFPREWSYPWRIVAAMHAAALEAHGRLAPAAIGAIHGYCHDISFNTNLPITAETPTAFYPDRKHIGGLMFARESVVGRSGGRPFDPEVGVIRIDGEAGQPLAVVYHFSAHPATCIEGEHLHGDYVSFASERIEAALPGAIALFLQGSLANTNIVPLFGVWQDAQRSGERLADEVLRVLPEITTTADVTTSVAQEPFPVTFMPYPTERLERFARHVRAFLAELETNPQLSWLGEGNDTINLAPRFTAERRRAAVLPLLSYCEDTLKRRAAGEPEPLLPWPTEIQVFRWNGIALCLHAFEMYCQTGFEIKRRSPLRYTFPVGNANSLVGYVVPQDEFAYGGYNAFTNPMYNARAGMWDPSNCDRIIDRFGALLRW